MPYEVLCACANRITSVTSLQGALHAANAELTAIASEKEILVKHLDKCQVPLMIKWLSDVLSLMTQVVNIDHFLHVVFPRP